MTILAIDPGTTESAWMTFDGKPVASGIVDNHELLNMLRAEKWFFCSHLAIEGIQCLGMPVGKETFETCIWIGRFVEAFTEDFTLVYRKDVKLHLCGSARAKDPNIRQALIDKFGGSKAAAIGVKKTPGPLYGVRSHVWSALAVAVTYCETNAALAAEL